ncbi:hypothetical protein MLD38_025093 [Melastoma candidum]|uniref:Uncharacterized protein n=1 Tax=Melastoma candidum TaxID=119954 RepID=A0ACB9NXD3_9MYRT|nr:hypothetical protein MLD38_025093 [Melastoma candidum]
MGANKLLLAPQSHLHRRRNGMVSSISLLTFGGGWKVQIEGGSHSYSCDWVLFLLIDLIFLLPVGSYYFLPSFFCDHCRRFGDGSLVNDIPRKKTWLSVDGSVLYVGRG